MKKTMLALGAVLVVVLILVKIIGTPINTIPDPHFDEDGYLIKDSVDSVAFTPKEPNRVKFFVEVSGSMNGFFLANAPTQFKVDVWEILSYFSNATTGVTKLTNEGEMGEEIALNTFQTSMNTGAFESSASTKVPVMLSSIIKNLNTENTN